MAFVFQNSDHIFTGSHYSIANGDTVHVTTGTVIASAETLTVQMQGGSQRTYLVNYGDIIGHANTVVYMGAGSSVLENHGLIRNNDDLSASRNALSITAAGSHRVVNFGDIVSPGRVVNVEGALDALSYTIQNHGLMQALYGHDLLREGGFAVTVTVENTGVMRGGTLAVNGSGRGYIDNAGRLETTWIDGDAKLGLRLVNTGLIEGWETSSHLGIAPGHVYLEGSAKDDLIRNDGTIRGTLVAGEGDDLVINVGGWTGALELGFGNDTFHGFGGRVEGTIDGGPDDDRFLIEDEGAILRGGSGIDTVVARSDVLDVAEVEHIILVGADNLEVFASDGAETILGNSGDNLLSGNGGADSINGGAGDDGISGGEGNDTLIGSSGDDEINGDAGNDSIRGGAGSDTLDGGFDNDIIIGDGGDDEINGNFGDDTLNGAFGNDTLDGGGDDDFMVGLFGDDLLLGGTGDDTVQGGTGADTLLGGDGADVLAGGAGNDRIEPGLGRDVALGGTGQDVFVYYSLAEIDDGVADRIKDFIAGEDLIDVSNIDEEDSFVFLGTGAFTSSGDMEIRTFQNAFGATFLQFDEDGNGTLDATLILLNTPDGVTAEDFIL